MPNAKPKVIVIGIDGGDYYLTKKWMGGGLLPNLKEIAESGVFGPLKSTIPPMTSPAWPSFMAGKNPGKHGVFDFVSFEKGKQEIVTSSKIGAETVFEMLSRCGKRVGVINVPVTYPPMKVNGFMISGYPCPYDDGKIVYPENYLADLKDSLGKYRANARVPYEKGKEEVCLKDLLDLLKTQEKFFFHSLKEESLDFLMWVTGITDTISHFFWRHFQENDPRFGDYILRIYQEVDKILGNLLDTIDNNTTVILMSDHGFGPLEATVNLNILLLETGLLKLKNTPLTRLKKFLFRKGLTPAEIFKVLKKVGLKKIAWVVPREKRDKALDSFLSFPDVDFERSTAISLGHTGQVFLLKKDKKEEVREALLSLENPATREKIVERVIDKEEVCSGPFFHKSPDFHVVFKDRKYVSYPLFAGSPKIIEENLPGNTGHHRDFGIFLAKGPNIKSTQITNAHIYDLAPTILSIFKLPQDPEFDGKVLNIFKNTPYRKNSVTVDKKRERREITASAKEKDLMAEKLRNLGYLS